MKIFKGNLYFLLLNAPLLLSGFNFNFLVNLSLISVSINIVGICFFILITIRLFRKYNYFIRITDKEIIKAGIVKDKSIKIDNVKELKMLEKGIILISKTGENLDIYLGGIEKSLKEEIISYLNYKIA